MSTEVMPGNFIICSSDGPEAVKLANETNIKDEVIIHIFSDLMSEPAIFQWLTEESETTTEDLNREGQLARILIGDSEEALNGEASRNGWDSSVWSGLILPQVDKVREYRKVYPVYTS